MSEVEMFRRICLKMKISEDKFVSQCLQTSEKTGVLDISNYTPTVKVCEAMAQVLSKSVSVIKLVTRDCLLPPRGFEAVMAILKKSRITDLCLTGNNISAGSIPQLAAAIRGNSMLKVLNLKWNNMGLNKDSFKKFCVSLAHNGSIEYLDLRSNQITTEGAIALARSLNKNSTIKKIDLRWNLLDSKGAESLLGLMENTQNIVNILLTGNPVAPEVVSSLGNCSKYKDGLKSIQSSYEAKLSVLTKHIREIEDRRIDHVDKLCKGTKEHLQNAELKINELTLGLGEKEAALKNMSHELTETQINLEAEKGRGAMLDKMIDEKEKNYLELIDNYQMTIENLRQELLKLENDIANRKIQVEKTCLNEKTQREQSENELEILKKSFHILKEDCKRCNEEIDGLNIRIESTEKEKKMWQMKCTELDQSFSNELQHLTKASAERQRKLEKNILELTENQAKNMEAVSEKLEYCLGEKATVEAQLTAAIATVSRLQQENSELINQLAQPSRRLAHVLEELTDEKIMNEKMRQEKHEMDRKLEESRLGAASLREEMSRASEAASEVVRSHRQQTQSIKSKALILAQKLKERDRLIETIREDERKRVKGLYSAVTSYMERIPPTDVQESPIQHE